MIYQIYHSTHFLLGKALKISSSLKRFLRLTASVVKPPLYKNAIGGKSLVNKVALTNNNKMFVAWHADVDFPYEYSKPLPVKEQKSASLLKEVALNSAQTAFKNKHPEIARQELMNLTYTTKHRWFPRSRDKKAKNTPMDRPYL